MGDPPEEIRLRDHGRLLEITYGAGETYALSAEYLRVESPSAEVKGHSREQRQWIGGKKNVAIREIVPVGNYAARLVFDDGHATGIFPWTTLLRYGREHDRLWAEYVAELKKRGLSRDS